MLLCADCKYHHYEDCQEKVKFRTPLMNTIIDLERWLENILKKREYIAIKCHNPPGDSDSGFHEINLLYYGVVQTDSSSYVLNEESEFSIVE